MMTNLKLQLAVIAVVAVVLTRSAGAQTEDEWVRPKLNPVVRHVEDWSSLAGHDTSQTGDLFDPIKYIPLNDDGLVYLSFGGQARYRFESFHNFGFGPANDDEYSLFRLRLHGDLHIGEHLRIFAEGKSALANNRDLPMGRRTLDVDSIDLQNLFADVMLPLGDDAAVTLRGGRQELLFGKQRLVSPLDWSNTRRTWDGVSLITKVGDWTITPFWTQFAPVQKYSFNDPDAQTEFYGVYATGPLPGDGAPSADLYFLGLDGDDAVMFNGTMGDEERYTVGGRLFGKIGDSGFDFDVEAACQFGEVGSGDVSAYMVGSELGYTLADVPTAPRVFVGFDFGSGDDSAGGDVETFNQLFPLGHAYLGFIDAIGRQNIIDLTSGVTFAPVSKLKVLVQGHLFWRADTSDAVYNAGGGVLRPGALSSEREVGAEIDVVLNYTFDQHTQVQFGYGHFFAGDFIEKTTPAADDDIDFFYLQLQFTF